MEEGQEAGLSGGRSGTVIQEQASADYTRSSEDEPALQSPHHYGKERPLHSCISSH